MSIQDWPLKVLFKQQHVSHLAKKKKLFAKEVLLTACGLRGNLADLNNPIVPRTCDACLRAVIREEAR